MLINKYLPDYHFSEKHTIQINAFRNQILKAIIELPPNEISFLFRFLFFIRSIPPKILGRRYIGFNPHDPLIKQLEEKGFKILERNDQEIVLGVIGQFGKLIKGKIYQIDDFINYNEIGSGKVALNFYLAGNDNEISLSTETRISTSDKKSRRKFAMYWMIVHPGSAVIRRIWLKAVKKRAEKERM